MKKIKRAALFFILFVFFTAFSHAQEERRGFYIDVGGGWAWLSYPEPLNTQVKKSGKCFRHHEADY